MLQSEDQIIKKTGGIQKFIGWHGPMLTDSGGFQIFSLGYSFVAHEIKKTARASCKLLNNITEEGAILKSYVGGKQWIFSPEKSIDIQLNLGADLIISLDECTPFHVRKKYTYFSMYRTHKWGIRSLRALDAASYKNQALYGVIQGGIYKDLRNQSCDFINNRDFFGYAIGGSLGNSKMQMYDIVSFVMKNIDKKRPVHLLGVGGISDIFLCVKMGIDTFDCVQPTRLARHGRALIRKCKKEHINLFNTCYKEDDQSLSYKCPCITCFNYTRAYLHHLLKKKEILAQTLITIHNVTFMNLFLDDIRCGINYNSLEKVKKNWIY